MVAELVGGLEQARRLSHDELSYWLELADYRQEMAQLTEQLSAMLGSPPPRGDDEQSAQARLEYSMDLTRLQCAIFRCEQCFKLPLDDEFGEQLDPPEAEHWWGAPGVIGRG